MSVAATKWQDVKDLHTGVQYTLGPNAADRYFLDPKRIGFLFARYKFAAKMLRDCDSIIDIGCGDGLGTLTFLQDTFSSVVNGVDTDADLIAHANTLQKAAREVRDDADILQFSCFDVFDFKERTGHRQGWEGLCCLDVIEHIEPDLADDFIGKLCDGILGDDGIAVIGTPSALASQYASEHSQVGHINLYSPDRFRDDLGVHFEHVFLFSMNDEIVHVGFDKMAHYLIALCIKG